MTFLLVAAVSSIGTAFALCLCAVGGRADDWRDAEDLEVERLEALYDLPARCGRAS